MTNRFSQGDPCISPCPNGFLVGATQNVRLDNIPSVSLVFALIIGANCGVVNSIGHNSAEHRP